ncbi:cytochrome P450 4A5 [Stigmatella aurantiaca DW4/3-1]|nr:cytochrome P450 4A5 [Stigmatella aurantiaca DW4/3-1]
MKKLSPAIGAGLSTLSGDPWKRQRRMANPAFSRASIATFEGIMQKAIAEAIVEWEARAGETIDVTGEMKRLTLRIVLLCLFSTDVSSRADEIIENLDVLQRYSVHLLWSMMPLPEFIPTRKNREYQKARGTLDSIIYGIIAERRKSGNHDRKDLLAMYMSAVDEETGEGMSDEQLRHELMNLFLAGHDTTANGLAFTFYLLSKHPEALKRVDEERDAVLGNGRMVTNEDLPQLNYARWSFEEALRIYPPTFAMSRTSVRELKHNDYVIPAGSNIFVCQWALHRNPRLWPNPDHFEPERFSPERSEGRHRFAYLPFGAGPRICIGAHLARTEAQMIIAMLLQRFRLNSEPGYEPRLVARLFVTAEPGISMRLSRR